MGALTLIVGAVSLVPATLAVVLRARVPTAVTGCLAHAAAVGLAVAVCSSDSLSPYTTWLLQVSEITCSGLARMGLLASVQPAYALCCC